MAGAHATVARARGASTCVCVSATEGCVVGPGAVEGEGEVEHGTVEGEGEVDQRGPSWGGRLRRWHPTAGGEPRQCSRWFSNPLVGQSAEPYTTYVRLENNTSTVRNPSVCLGGLSSCFCAREWTVCHSQL